MSNSSNLLFNNDKYSCHLLRQLDRLRCNKEYCDLILVAENERFSTHKNVMVAASPYFAAMFGGGLKESHQAEVVLKDVSSSIFNVILKFIYSGSINVTTDICQELLTVADLFRMDDIVEACCQFLVSQLHPSNCIGFYQFAELHGCYDLKEISERFVTENILQVSKEEEYSMVPVELLIKFLQSENLRVDNEFQVFHIALEWLLYDPSNRRHLFYDVFSPIRFMLISRQLLITELGSCTDLSLKVGIQKLLFDLWKEAESPYNFYHKHSKSSLLKPRKHARKNIYVIGGFQRAQGGRWSDSISLCNVEYFDTFHQSWHKMAPIQYAKSGHGVCVIDNNIYVVGGENDSLIYDQVEQFDPVKHEWSLVHSMNSPRCGLGICVVNSCIYAVGGWIGCEIGKTIEMYDPLEEQWCVAGEVLFRRYALGVVSHHDLIYIMGGIDEQSSEVDKLEAYNPVSRTWFLLKGMQIKRAYFGVTVLNNCIYVVGGWNSSIGMLDSVEKYNIKENSWQSVSSLLYKKAGISVTSVNGLIYAFGGRITKDLNMAPPTLDSAECYDPETDEWFEIAPMPTSRCEAAIAVL